MGALMPLISCLMCGLARWRRIVDLYARDCCVQGDHNHAAPLLKGASRFKPPKGRALPPPEVRAVLPSYVQVC